MVWDVWGGIAKRRNQLDFAKSTFFTKSAYKKQIFGGRHYFFFQNEAIHVYTGVEKIMKKILGFGFDFEQNVEFMS